jgi:hypothetical protein
METTCWGEKQRKGEKYQTHQPLPVVPNKVSPVLQTNLVSQISYNQQYLKQIICKIEDEIKFFKAGQIKYNLNNWKKLTNDCNILEMITGYNLEFLSLPIQNLEPKPLKFDENETKLINNEIERLLKAEVIKVCDREKGDWVSNIFGRLKKDGSMRLILNLKQLNPMLVYRHFKMDTIQNVISMVRPNCFMASIDIKDAYYAISITQDNQKYMKFQWGSLYYCYQVLVMGLSSAPERYTKLMKPVYAHLRKMGFESVAYLDDTFLKGDTFEDCVVNVIHTVQLFRSLGLTVHPTKSVLIPTQSIVFLGFIINSVEMTVTLTEEKKCIIFEACKSLLQNKKPLIREVSRVIGLFVSAFPAVIYGPLYYRYLEFNKTQALRLNKGNFDAHIKLSDKSLFEITWWSEHIHTAYAPIMYSNKPDIVLETDSSLKGWGCFNKTNKSTIGGEWGAEEKKHMHINALELKAALLSLQSFCSCENNKHIHLMMDNITAVAYVREMGGSKSMPCNDLAYEIWQFAKSRRLWLTSSYLKGTLNCIADKMSREFQRDLEYKLNEIQFIMAKNMLGLEPEIDLFASRLNYQLKPYVSYKPDPEAHTVDAFSFHWGNMNFYAFPPFSLLPRVLQKISKDKGTGIVIVPFWTTQSFFPTVLNMLIMYPVFLASNPRLLYLPSEPNLKHPLHKKLNLLACLISGDNFKHQAFLKRLKTSSCKHGDLQPKSSILAQSINGHSIVVKGVQIPFLRQLNSV